MGPDEQRALVAATKPELRLLPTVELNAETPAHLLDDDITPLSRLFARNTGTMPVPERIGHRRLDAGDRRLRAHAAALDDSRAAAAVRDRDADRGARMRRQRAGVLSRARRHRAVAARRRRLRRLDRRAARRSPARVRADARRRLHRASQPGPAARRPRPGAVARAADRKSARARDAGRLGGQRRADPAAARRAAAHRRAGLSRLGLAEMDHADRDPRLRARRRAHAQPALSPAARCRCGRCGRASATTNRCSR